GAVRRTDDPSRRRGPHDSKEGQFMTSNRSSVDAVRARAAHWPFASVLVANRGEIAVRVLRTVQALGLKGIVVYHAADRGSPAVRMADAAVEITGSTPVAAYLDAQQIIAAARSSGAGAIHPGYGFLSENKAFCEAVEAAGIRFVGPTPEQI